jgi:hypothetical protein
MNFDIQTLREELAALEKRVGKDRKATERYLMCSRLLRAKEYEENGYVTARNSVTGY